MKTTEIGCLKRQDEFYLEGEKYKVIGLSTYRSFNNVLCQSTESKKQRWLDQGSEVEVDEKEGEEE